jgi:uncharacterized protein YkwD
MVLSAGADAYTTSPAPSAVRGGQVADGLDASLADIARARGLHLTPDGRLADLATFVGSNLDADGRPPAPATLDAYARHLGLIEPVPLLMIFGESHEGRWSDPMQDMLKGAPRNIAYNRYGISVVDRLGQRVAVVVLSAALVEVEPVPRLVGDGAQLALRGRVRSGYTHPQLDMTLPDGSVKHVAESSGSTFDFNVPTTPRGVHRVELLADGPFGIEVLANFPVFAGVPEPPIVARPRTDKIAADPGDESAVADRLLELLNDARRKAGLAALQSHRELAEVAAAHSRDMVESGFFGHLSPTNGDPAARVRKKGLAFVLIAENVGRGATADEVNAMLLDSPGHRANALDPNLTHVGIGVVVDRRQGQTQVVATEEFGGVAKTIDAHSAPGSVTDLINEKRAAAGAAMLVTDPALTDAAQRGADMFLSDPSRTQQQVVEWVNETLAHPGGRQGSPIAKRMRAAQSFLLPVIALDQVQKIEATADKSARYIGVGVAQGSRADTGPNAIALVIVLGWPRQ